MFMLSLKKYPLLDNIWDVMDGLKLCLQSPRDQMEKYLYYNGWAHDHYTSNLFLFLQMVEFVQRISMHSDAYMMLHWLCGVESLIK